MSLQALLKFEGPANYVKLFFGFSHIPGVSTVLDRIFWVRLGVLKKYYVMLR